MSSETIFRMQLILGYAAWLLCFGAYVMPWLRSMDRVAAQFTVRLDACGPMHDERR